MWIDALPAVNATLNATAGVLLSSGYLCIRAKKVAAHRACMVAAFLTSVVFLASYLTYHIHRAYVTGEGPTKFLGPGWVKPVYLTMLVSHTILALAVVPLVLITMHRAWRQRFDRHVRIARWTLPIWIYVSVTGVVIYGTLYHLYPQG